MNRKPTILFITEGQRDEPEILKSMIEFFEKEFDYNSNNFEILVFPNFGSIYKLFVEIRKDEDVDTYSLLKENLLNEHLRQKQLRTISINRNPEELIKFIVETNPADISETYLFFDLDYHTDSIPKELDKDQVIHDMLNLFNEETQQGRLFINYPMSESIRHLDCSGKCKQNQSNCLYRVSEGANYKPKVNEETICPSIGDLKDIWPNVIDLFVRRLSCLLNLNEPMTAHSYKEIVNLQKSVFEKQKLLLNGDQVLVISSFSQFILDYFKQERIEKYFTNQDINHLECPDIFY